MQALQILYDAFAAGYGEDKTVFVPSYNDVGRAALQSFDETSVVVQQVQNLEPDIALPDTLRSAKKYSVPLVSASFLWPFAGEEHPRNANHPFLDGGPYPGELGDGFLNRLILQGVSPDDAPNLYRNAQISEKALERRFELVIDRQRRCDEICDYSIAPEIEKHFRNEPLFFSPHHPGARISNSLAAQCFHRLGAPSCALDLLTTQMRRSPFPHDELPIHPAVASYFKLTYSNANTTYSFRGEGRFTLDQWIRRYMRYDWEPGVYEAAAVSETDPTRARDLLAGVLKRLPDSSLGHLSLAKALSKLGDAEQAAVAADKAVALDADNPTAWRTAAVIAMQRGQLVAARRFAASAVKADPSNVSNIGLLAKIQEDLSDFASAEWSRRQMTFFAPRESEHRAALGTTLLHQPGREVEAFAEYSRGVALDPKNAGARFGISIVLARSGHTEEAIEAVRMAIAVIPDVGLYHSHLGHLLGRVNRLDEATVAFNRVLEFEPSNAGIHSAIATLMLRQQQRDRALWHMRRAVEIEPNTPRYLILFSEMLVECNRHSEAIAPLSKALAVGQDNAQLRLRLGLLLVRDHRLDEAAAAFQEASRLDVQDAEGPIELSRVLERMGDLGGAEKAVERALTLRPGDEKLISQQKRLIYLRQGGGYAQVPSRHLIQAPATIVPGMWARTPKCLVYTNFPDVNPEFARHHLDGLYIERERYLPPVSVGRLDPSVSLAVPDGEDFIPFIGNKVLADQVRQDWDDDKLRQVLHRCRHRATIDGPALLIGRFGIRTWGHWLGELLPKLIAVEAAMPNRFRFILPERIVTDPHHSTGLESLRHYGIDLERLILVSAETTYNAPELHVVTPVWSPDHMIHPMVTEIMRTHHQSKLPTLAGPERVALLRRGARTRKLTNTEDVQALLERRGWTVLDIEGMSFVNQTRLFQSAKSIVSVLGSGLTGLMYSPPGVKIMTLAPSHWGDLFFFALMQDRSATLVDIRGTSIATAPGEIATAAFSVDLREVDKGLTELDAIVASGAR